MPDETEFVETLIPGPNDQQPFEQSQAQHDFQAISDKTPVSGEEMRAYWRLMRWSMTQTFDELKERSRDDLFFTNFADIPNKLRGQPIRLKLSLRRVLKHDDLSQNSVGAKEVYEAWGVTNESRSGLYVVAFYDKPPQLRVGAEVHEEAEFVGYFLKLMSYEDYAVQRWAPLLIGRLHWRENLTRSALRRQREGGDFWPWLIVAGGVVVLGVAWKWTRPSRGQNLDATVPPDHAAIERWLEDGAPEQSPSSTGVCSEWENSADADAEMRPTSLPTEPTISPSRDVRGGD
jgi:hypothetical protein